MIPLIVIAAALGGFAIFLVASIGETRLKRRVGTLVLDARFDEAVKVETQAYRAGRIASYARSVVYASTVVAIVNAVIAVS